jgi:hypothetical protein
MKWLERNIHPENSIPSQQIIFFAKDKSIQNNNG